MIVAIAQRQTALDAMLAQLNGGSVKLYSGPRPAGLVLAGNTLLASPAFANPAFGATSSSGVATANPIAVDPSPVSSGIVSFALACKADGTPVFNLSVGTSGADIIVDSTTVTMGIGVTIATGSIQFPIGV